MEIKYEPECFKAEDSEFEGHVVIKAPTFAQRATYKLKCRSMDIPQVEDENGEKSLDLSSPQALESFGLMSECVRDHIQEVAIKHKASGSEITSWESVESDPDLDGLVIEVSLKMLMGFSAGNRG